MTWLDAPGFERRPLVFVEDHLYHTTELLAAVASARPDLLAHMTVCGIDRGGPDSTATIAEWLDRYPALQIAAAASASDRVQTVGTSDLSDAAAFARMIARLLRPGGVLVQDVQLATLPFLPADRWWESIYVAATVRGLFADRPPIVRFLSNKRGYSATFGRDLADAGFDPRDVMEKSELTTVVVPAVAALFDRGFPLTLEGVIAENAPRTWRVANHPNERAEIEHVFDLVLWITADALELGGRLIGHDQVVLRPGSHETTTWHELIRDRLHGGSGLPVAGVGARIGPAQAERAELSNLAARHIHTLRGRLADAAAIVTVNHAYRLGDRVSAAIVSRPTSGGLREP